MAKRRTAALVALALLVAPFVLHIGASLAPGYGSYAVTGASMEPTIASGSLVVVHASGSYSTGDVITFTQTGERVTHRIVEETAAGYVTKGDANDAVDGWRVTDSQISGELLFTVPFYGTALAVVGTPTGYFAFVLVPVVVISALELRAIWTDPRGK